MFFLLPIIVYVESNGNQTYKNKKKKIKYLNSIQFNSLIYYILKISILAIYVANKRQFWRIIKARATIIIKKTWKSYSRYDRRA